MEQKDHLMKQIEQMARILGQMIARLLGTNNVGDTNIVFEEIKQEFDTELNINLEELLNCNNDLFLEKLISEYKLSINELDLFADLLYELHRKNNNKKILLEKSLLIYEHISKNSTTYNFTWNTKILSIKEIIHKL